MSDEIQTLVNEEVVEKARPKKKRVEVVELVESEMVELPKRKKPIIDRSSIKSNSTPIKQVSFKNTGIEGYFFKP